MLNVEFTLKTYGTNHLFYDYLFYFLTATFWTRKNMPLLGISFCKQLLNLPLFVKFTLCDNSTSTFNCNLIPGSTFTLAVTSFAKTWWQSSGLCDTFVYILLTYEHLFISQSSGRPSPVFCWEDSWLLH